LIVLFLNLARRLRWGLMWFVGALLTCVILQDFPTPAFAICALLGLIGMSYSLAARFLVGIMPGGNLLFFFMLSVAVWMLYSNGSTHKLRFDGFGDYYVEPVDLSTARALYDARFKENRDRVDDPPTWPAPAHEATPPCRGPEAVLVPDITALNN